MGVLNLQIAFYFFVASCGVDSSRVLGRNDETLFFLVIIRRKCCFKSDPL